MARLYDNFKKNILDPIRKSFDDSLKSAPSKNYNTSVTYIPLYDRETGKLKGSLVLELLILAQHKELRSQANGANADKKPFELAMVPTSESDPVKIRAQISKVVTAEFEYRRKTGKPFVTNVSKVRVMDYVEFLVTDRKEGDQVIKSPYMLASERFKNNEDLASDLSPKDLYVTLDNAPGTTSMRERRLQWLGAWAASLGALVAAAAVLPTVLPVSMAASVSFAGLLAYAAGMYVATKAGKIFSMYDTAVFFNREIPWVQSGHAFKGKTKWSYVLDTAFKMAVVVGLSSLAGAGAYAGVSSLGLWSMLPAVIATPSVLLLSSFLAASAAAATFAGVYFAIRYLDGLSPFDNRIDPNEATLSKSYLDKLDQDKNKSNQPTVEQLLKEKRDLEQTLKTVLESQKENKGAAEQGMQTGNEDIVDITKVLTPPVTPSRERSSSPAPLSPQAQQQADQLEQVRREQAAKFEQQTGYRSPSPSPLRN